MSRNNRIAEDFCEVLDNYTLQLNEELKSLGIKKKISKVEASKILAKKLRRNDYGLL